MTSQESSSKPFDYQTSVLFQAPLGMREDEARIFALAIDHLILRNRFNEPIEEASTLFKIPCNRAAKYSSNDFDISPVSQGCTELYNRSIPIRASNVTANTPAKFCRIIQSIEYSTIREPIIGRFADDILSDVLKLHEAGMSVSDMQALVQIKTQYSYNLYWFLSTHNEGGKCTIEIEKLRSIFFNERSSSMYPLYSNFKRFVLEAAIEELYRINWTLSYSEVRHGRKVNAIQFILPGKAAFSQYVTR